MADERRWAGERVEVVLKIGAETIKLKGVITLGAPVAKPGSLIIELNGEPPVIEKLRRAE